MTTYQAKAGHAEHVPDTTKEPKSKEETSVEDIGVEILEKAKDKETTQPIQQEHGVNRLSDMPSGRRKLAQKVSNSAIMKFFGKLKAIIQGFRDRYQQFVKETKTSWSQAYFKSKGVEEKAANFGALLKKSGFSQEAALFGAKLLQEGKTQEEATFGATLREYDVDETKIIGEVADYKGAVKAEIAKELVNPDFDISFAEGKISKLGSRIDKDINRTPMKVDGVDIEKKETTKSHTIEKEKLRRARNVETKLRAKYEGLKDDQQQKIVKTVLQIAQQSTLFTVFSKLMIERQVASTKAQFPFDQFEINTDEKEAKITVNHCFLDYQRLSSSKSAIRTFNKWRNATNYSRSTIKRCKKAGFRMSRLSVEISFPIDNPSKVTIEGYPTITRL
ncbi:MAG: hypothetical protein HN411_04220 [Waddliaceae bacterium]|nr:hypothetical protein [Waddliaceae bacterium]MBT3579559.1 hypothetical protein [Waddliaceae bacterium]MBT4444602.1 hypothetical protein [Waddliaceae bacterium]